MNIERSGTPPQDRSSPHEAAYPPTHLSNAGPAPGENDAPFYTHHAADSMNEFRFCTKLDQTMLLGRRASTLPELVEGIMSVPRSSIYYHTHHFLQAHPYLTPEPSNDFAYWIAEVINDVALGERLSSIDIVGFKSITEFRAFLVEFIASRIRRTSRLREAAGVDGRSPEIPSRGVRPDGSRSSLEGEAGDCLGRRRDSAADIPHVRRDLYTFGRRNRTVDPSAVNEPDYARRLGINGREHIKNNYLITRNLRDYLLPYLSLFQQGETVYL